MYFWNVDALADDLKNNRVNQYHQMAYLLGINLMAFFLMGLNQLRNIILHIQISTPELNRLIVDIRKFFKVPVKHRGILYLRILQEDLIFWLIKAVFIGILFAVVIWGIRYCYQKNKAGDDKDFIKRMVCLSFPAAIQYGVFGIAFSGLAIYFLPELLSFLNMAYAIQLILEELLPIAVLFLILFFMYRRIGGKLSYIGKK